MNTRIRAIGFDLGETLLFYRDTPLSWVSLYSQALAKVAAACKTSPTTEQMKAAENILSRHNTRIVPRTNEVPAGVIFSEILDTWELDVRANLDSAIGAFFKFFQQRMNAYADVAPTLRALREKQFRIGMLTDVPYGMPRNFVEEDIAGAGLSRLIETLVTSVDVGKRKPEIDGFRALAKRLGVETAQMLYIGNEPKDVIGANAAGSIAVFLDRNGSKENHGQAYTVTSLAELLQIVAR